MSSEKVIQAVDGLKITDFLAKLSDELVDKKITMIGFLDGAANLEGMITEGEFDLTAQDIHEAGYCKRSTVHLQCVSVEKIQEFGEWIKKHWVDYPKSFEHELENLIKEGDKK